MLVGVLLLLSRPARADLEMVFYDPDANLANIARLRAKMSAFLRSIDGDARFIAFAKLADLKRHLSKNDVHFVIVSHSARPALRLDLREVAKPLRNKDDTYKKVLVVKRPTTAADIKVVATTSSRAEIEAIDLSERPASAGKIRVLRVSKGFDALLGMAFGRADAAYVTPATVEALKTVDESLWRSLNVIYESAPIPNPRLYAVVPNTDANQISRVVAAFKEMNRSRLGKPALEILDYSSWSVP